MGEWSKKEFGTPELPKKCFIFAMTVDEYIRESILSYFKTIKFHKHDSYEAYIVNDGKEDVLLLFQIFGAVLTADILYILNEGNVKEIILIGFAYGLIGDLKVGDIIIPDKVQCLDGITNFLEDIDYTYPNELIQSKIIQTLEDNNHKYFRGITISVASLFWRPEKLIKAIDTNAIALEMEFASFCCFSKKLGIASAGVLIISDTNSHSLLDDTHLRTENMLKVFECLK